MREIKFRGKRVDNGEWVYGDRVSCDGNTFIICGGRGYDDLGTTTRLSFGEWYEVIPDTVGQYTGLTDKNGKEIYEGDLLKFYDHGDWMGLGHCFYDTDETAFRHTFHEVHDGKPEYDSQRPPKRFWSNNNMSCEIIDTIHDKEIEA